MSLEKKSSENTVEKGENAGNKKFLLFQQCFFFYPIKIEIAPFEPYWNFRLQILSIWTRLMINVNHITTQGQLLPSLVISRTISSSQTISIYDLKKTIDLTLSQTSPCFYVSAVHVL